jgi:hypothetical protein
VPLDRHVKANYIFDIEMDLYIKILWVENMDLELTRSLSMFVYKIVEDLNSDSKYRMSSYRMGTIYYW